MKPPDKGKSIEFSSQDNESTYDENEIKQDPDVKLESEDVDDMVTVPISERATSCLVIDLIGGEQTDYRYYYRFYQRL